MFPTLRLQPFDRLIIVGTNLRRRSDSMLQRSFNRRNTLAACVPSRVRSFGFIVTPVRREAPTHRKCNSKTISTETRKLLAALGFQPRTFTSLSSPSGLTEFTARCMDVTPRLDRLMIYLGHSGDPCRDTLVARSTSLSVRLPDEPNLCFYRSPAHYRSRFAPKHYFTYDNSQNEHSVQYPG